MTIRDIFDKIYSAFNCINSSLMKVSTEKVEKQEMADIISSQEGV
jgi:hypothetical protein